MPRGALRRARTRDGPITPPLEQALPLVLIGDHLTADSKLACFGTNKGMAEQLLRNAACTKLMLKPGCATSAGSSNGSSSRSSSSKGAQASVRTAQQLAAQSSNVALALHGGLLTPASCLWQRITSIHLQGVQLSPYDLSSRSQLQLHKLPRLQTLSLEACHMHADSATQQGPAAASSIRTLKCMRCTPPRTSVLRMLLSLLDPGQLQTLITDDSTATDLLAQLPALQDVQLLRETWSSPDDSAFQQLLQHPSLTRVSLASLSLTQDYSDQPCNWASLTLTRSVGARSLAALPLANIESCTVQDGFGCGHGATRDQLDRAISNANRCPRLVFQPSRECCWWSPSEPTFIIRGTTELDARSIALVMRHIALGQHGAVMMYNNNGARSFLSPAVVAALATAPHTVTTLGFKLCRHSDAWEEVREVEAGVVMRLPAHIRHVVFHTDTELSTEQWQGVLRWFMTGVTRPLRLTLGLYRYDHIWPANIQQAVQEWLSTHFSNQVQVGFQCVRL